MLDLLRNLLRSELKAARCCISELNRRQLDSQMSESVRSVPYARLVLYLSRLIDN